MNRYETFFILESDIPDTEREPIFEKVKNVVPQKNGTLLMFDDWGTRKLAYPIKKKMHGRYVRLDYCGVGGLVDDLERFFRLEHRILKYMTILLDSGVDPEALKESLESQESEIQEQTETVQSSEDAAEGDSENTDENEPVEETVQTESDNEE